MPTSASTKTTVAQRMFVLKPASSSGTAQKIRNFESGTVNDLILSKKVRGTLQNRNWTPVAPALANVPQRLAQGYGMSSTCTLNCLVLVSNRRMMVPETSPYLVPSNAIFPMLFPFLHSLRLED